MIALGRQKLSAIKSSIPRLNSSIVSDASTKTNISNYIAAMVFLCQDYCSSSAGASESTTPDVDFCIFLCRKLIKSAPINNQQWKGGIAHVLSRDLSIICIA